MKFAEIRKTASQAMEELSMALDDGHSESLSAAWPLSAPGRPELLDSLPRRPARA